MQAKNKILDQQIKIEILDQQIKIRILDLQTKIKVEVSKPKAPNHRIPVYVCCLRNTRILFSETAL